MSERSSRTTDMSSFPKITVVSDGLPVANAAVERAAQLAAQHGADLCLLQACDSGASHSSGPALNERVVMLRERLAVSACMLERCMDMQVESVVDIGPEHVVISEHVQKRRPSLLVLGSRFPPAAAGASSTALKLLREPACPVLVVRSNSATPYRQVMSAVDLREGAVRAAMAALLLFPQAHHRLLYAVAQSPLHESMHRHAERELSLLAQALSAKSMHAVRADVAGNVPARAVMVGAAALPADCVVVGHHDTAAVEQTELDSMARHVLQFVPCDVLVVP